MLNQLTSHNHVKVTTEVSIGSNVDSGSVVAFLSEALQGFGVSVHAKTEGCAGVNVMVQPSRRVPVSSVMFNYADVERRFSFHQLAKVIVPVIDCRNLTRFELRSERGSYRACRGIRRNQPP